MSDNFWGALVLSLRTEKGISQRMLASRAKVSRSTLRKIEAGESAGDIALIERLLAFLGYELEAISLTDEGDPGTAYARLAGRRRSRVAASRILTLQPEPRVV